MWNPCNGHICIANFPTCIMKLRKGRIGGGVAILARKGVKVVHLTEYDKDGLEAVWVDAMIGSDRIVFGSVYVPPGDSKALELFDSVLGNILQHHNTVIIGMDANSRSVCWDDSCIGCPRYSKSLLMGDRLEQIILTHSLTVHNDGNPTYRSNNVATAPDVTLSVGIRHLGKASWRILDDDLRSPHETILLTFGKDPPIPRLEVLHWKNFDWDTFQTLTCSTLHELCDKWTAESEENVDHMVDQLSDCILGCVDKVASKRIISKHSKPWISSEISLKLKELRQVKKRCRLRRSRINKKKFQTMRQEVCDMLKRAEYDWWLAECNKLPTMNESKKWKAIEKLTNHSSGYGIQPIRITEQGRLRYLFSDSEICHEMEQYHITKSSSSSTPVQDEWFKGQVQIMMQQAHDGQGDAIMNDEINDGEIAMTFGKCSDTPGPDKISASLLDGADRTVMHECLRIIWNKAWQDGYRISLNNGSWKVEQFFKSLEKMIITNVEITEQCR